MYHGLSLEGRFIWIRNEFFFHLESDFKKSFFNLIFYHKHLGFALYMAFWVNHFLFHASLPYIFQRAIFNTTPNPISRFHRQNKLLGFKLDFYFIVAFCSRRGNQNFEFFSICYYTNSSMKKLWELISVCDVLVDWVTTFSIGRNFLMYNVIITNYFCTHSINFNLAMK